MRTIFCLISFFFTYSALDAQDTLYKSEVYKQIVKIVEVTETQVKYKLAANLNGPIYVINKVDVLKIVYETGLIETFPKNINKNKIPGPRNIDFGRNFIFLNVSDLLFDFFTIGYEYTSKSGKYSLKFPFSFGLDKMPNFSSYGYMEGYYYYQGSYHNTFNIFSTGLDFNFHPFGQGKSKFFFGPSFVFGEFGFGIYYPHLGHYLHGKGTYNDFLLQTGILFQPLKQINFSINAGIGYGCLKSIKYYSTLYQSEGIAARGGFNIGYKF